MVLLIIGALAATSAGAGFVGERYLGLTRGSAPSALAKLLECLGLSLLFMILNVAVVTGVAFGIRTLTPFFVSAYSAGDASVVVFSVCQAIAFQWWRFSGHPERSTVR